jgi:hypothetical protein
MKIRAKNYFLMWDFGNEEMGFFVRNKNWNFFLLNRNFLDEISYEIVDWLRDEEAKYQADLLAQEVQTYARQATSALDTIKAAAAVIEAGGKKGKEASGKSIIEIFFKYFLK